MSVLESVLRLKQMEQDRQNAAADKMHRSLSALSNVLQNRRSQNIQQQQIQFNQNRQGRIDDLNKQNILSQIEARKPSALEQMITKSKVLEAAGGIADATGRPEDIAIYDKLRGSKSINSYLDSNVSASMPITDVGGEIVSGSQQRTNIQLGSLGVGLERTPTGKLTDVGKEQLKAQANEISQNQAVQKEVAAQDAKTASSTRQDFTNAQLKIDNTFDSFLDVAERTMEISGVGPGVLSGAITKVLGETRANEFYQGFKGGLVEYAAAVGRISMPGSRATRLINLFKKTAPTTFDTIESGIQTTADSLRNALSTDMSRNAKEYLTEEQLKLPVTKQNEILKDQLRDFESTFRNGMLKQVYKRNPDLLGEDTQMKVEEMLTPEEIQNMLGGA